LLLRHVAPYSEPASPIYGEPLVSIYGEPLVSMQRIHGEVQAVCVGAPAAAGVGVGDALEPHRHGPLRPRLAVLEREGRALLPLVAPCLLYILYIYIYIYIYIYFGREPDIHISTCHHAYMYVYIYVHISQHAFIYIGRDIYISRDA
jgi:hypothetical protein